MLRITQDPSILGPGIPVFLQTRPFTTFLKLNAVYVLKVKFEVLRRKKCFSALCLQMWTNQGFSSL